MNSLKKISTAMVACAILFLFLTWNTAIGDVTASPCSGAGVWMVTGESGDFWLNLSVPLENSNKSLGMTFQWVTFDATLGGLFPNATITPVEGIAEAVGYNLYNYTNLGYGMATDRTILYILRGSGSFSFVNCDTIESSGTLGIYHPSQDPFGDESPAYGCYPAVGTIIRMPNVPPCD